MKRYRRAAAGISIAAAVLAGAAPGRAADKPPPPVPAPGPAPGTPDGRVLGTEGAWSAYASEDRTGQVCYLIGEAEKSLPPGPRRRPPSALVTHRPRERVANVVSIVVGYPLKPGSEVSLAVGGRRFDLFVSDDSGWARTPELDREIVDTLAKSRDAVARGVPVHGAPTVDTYSLAGFVKALALIDKECGVKR